VCLAWGVRTPDVDWLQREYGMSRATAFRFRAAYQRAARESFDQMQPTDALPAETLKQRPDPVIPLEDDDGR